MECRIQIEAGGADAISQGTIGEFGPRQVPFHQAAQPAVLLDGLDPGARDGLAVAGGTLVDQAADRVLVEQRPLVIEGQCLEVIEVAHVTSFQTSEKSP
jgi:hypothetical protein